MAKDKFFGREKSIGKLDIDADATSSDSPHMQKRLDRISSNYEQMDTILSELEAKIAINDELAPKKKSNPAPEQASDRPVSANPKKPR